MYWVFWTTVYKIEWYLKKSMPYWLGAIIGAVFAYVLAKLFS